MSHAPTTVSANWLAQNLHNPAIVIFDCHCNVPNIFEDEPLYPTQHIPGAFLCSIDDVSDKNSTLPHTLPPPEQFSEFAQKYGVHKDSHIICYSFGALFAAPRLWWMFRVFGHARVSVLNASLAQWNERNLPLSGEESIVHTDSRTSPFQAVLQPHLLADSVQVKQASAESLGTIVDVRPPPRFHGETPEPRDIPAGHIPGSHNLSFTNILNQDNTLVDDDQIRQVFDDTNIDPDKPQIFSCGSGIAACIVAWGQAHIGGSNMSAVYDGSWSEWASDPKNPVER